MNKMRFIEKIADAIRHANAERINLNRAYLVVCEEELFQHGSFEDGIIGMPVICCGYTGQSPMIGFEGDITLAESKFCKRFRDEYELI